MTFIGIPLHVSSWQITIKWLITKNIFDDPILQSLRKEEKRFINKIVFTLCTISHFIVICQLDTRSGIPINVINLKQGEEECYVYTILFMNFFSSFLNDCIIESSIIFLYIAHSVIHNMLSLMYSCSLLSLLILSGNICMKVIFQSVYHYVMCDNKISIHVCKEYVLKIYT